MYISAYLLYGNKTNNIMFYEQFPKMLFPLAWQLKRDVTIVRSLLMMQL